MVRRAGNAAPRPVGEVAERERKDEEPSEVHEGATDQRERRASRARLVAPGVGLHTVFGEPGPRSRGIGALALPERPECVPLRLHHPVGLGEEHVGRRRIGDAVHPHLEHAWLPHVHPPPRSVDAPDSIPRGILARIPHSRARSPTPARRHATDPSRGGDSPSARSTREPEQGMFMPSSPAVRCPMPATGGQCTHE